MADQTPDPIEYPQIVIGGKSYEVRFRALDVVNLNKEHKIDLLKGTGMDFSGAEGIVVIAKLLQAGIAHVDAVDLDSIMASIDFADLGRYIAAAISAQKKASEQIVSALAVVTPTPAPTPASPSTVQ